MVRSPTGGAPLQKGLACARCKARKTKCDGVKPACGACIRSARFKHLPVDQVVCVYHGESASPGTSTPATSAVDAITERPYKQARREFELPPPFPFPPPRANSAPSTSTATFPLPQPPPLSFTLPRPPLSTNSTETSFSSYDSYASTSTTTTTPEDSPSISFPLPALSLPIAMPLTAGPSSLQRRRMNAPQSISIPTNTQTGWFAPQSAPPTFGTFAAAQLDATTREPLPPEPEPSFASLPLKAAEAEDLGMSTPWRELLEEVQWGQPALEIAGATPGVQFDQGANLWSPWPTWNP